MPSVSSNPGEESVVGLSTDAGQCCRTAGTIIEFFNSQLFDSSSASRL